MTMNNDEKLELIKLINESEAIENYQQKQERIFKINYISTKHQYRLKEILEEERRRLNKIEDDNKWLFNLFRK